jgi:hypothetical protein
MAKDKHPNEVDGIRHLPDCNAIKFSPFGEERRKCTCGITLIMSQPARLREFVLHCFTRHFKGDERAAMLKMKELTPSEWKVAQEELTIHDLTSSAGRSIQ